jgi:MoxR-like ATPase
LGELTNRDAVLAAIKEHDTLGREAFLAKHGYSPARRYQLVHDGKSYDAKAIVGVAFGHQFPERGPLHPSEFSGGDGTVVPLLKKLDFDVRTIQAKGGTDRDDGANIVAPPQTNPVQTGLEDFLTIYPSARSTVVFGQHGDVKNKLNLLRSALEALPAVRSRPHIRVSWSVGQGKFAFVPWIALLDERETTSTQRGIYGVFLFPENMSGVYLTLNQGTTDTIQQTGRIEGRSILRQQAEAMRQILGPQLRSFSFANDIDLRTEGDRGQDYQASTIAHRYYAKGIIPEDQILNDDLEQLLAGYDEILKQRPTLQQPSPQWWIFQANPKMYNIDGAVHDLSELTWTVKHEALQVSVGDRVFFWRAGREAGVIALGTIIDRATVRENLPTEEQYVLNTERLGGSQSRVLVRVDRRLDEPLLRTAIAAEPRLKDLMILRFANYSTFKVPPHHAQAIVELLENLEQPAADAAPEIGRRVWVYAPGGNAEFWDEFYEAGIMAIGWDELGDLSQYGSLDDMLAALQQQYAPEGRPTNNARSCYDFMHTIRVGDRVFVKRGRNTIIGYGTVAGEYEHRADRTQFKNVRTVRWEGKGTWGSPAPLAVKTLTDVTEDTASVSALENMVSGPIGETPKPVPAATREPYGVEQAIDGLFMEGEAFRRALSIWRQKKNLILQGAPGVGKSFIARRLAYALMGYRDPSRVRTVQFHQSYSYEDFVQGYRPSGNGLSLQQGVFLEFCEKALTDPNEIYVFTIDEINRGNLSKILGELMLLIEPDKRSPEWATKLAYAPAAEERFYVPSNVFLLGMMNTADRSLSFVDYALRRRFAFATLRPEYGSDKFRQHLVSRGASVELVDRIVARMSSLNEDIAADKTNLGPGFCVGHSFFCSAALEEALDNDWYQRVVSTEILPLLEEYWFDNPARADEWHDRLVAD